MALTFGSLFAGIGGIDLGLERAGMICKFQVEIDDHATRVLAKHWPDVPRFRDVRSVGAHNLPQVDLLAGGFPCQDISNAGKRAGITGERSGLWTEFYRLIRELRPDYVLVENVTALLVRGMGRVLGDLATIGYDTEWQCIPAAVIGAPHIRDRVFMLAYSDNKVSDADGARLAQRQGFGDYARTQLATIKRGRHTPRDGHWTAEPAICRMVDGFSGRLDRLRGLGNAVVPQVAEYIGKLIVAHATQ